MRIIVDASLSLLSILINFFINRVRKYNPNGRMQTESEAKVADREIMKLLDSYKVPYFVVDGSLDGSDTITDVVLKMFK